MARTGQSSYGEAMSLIRAGEIPRLYVLWGDDYLCGRLVRSLRERLFESGGEDFDLLWLDGVNHGPGELLAAVRTVPFLSPRRMVVVERVRAFRPASRGPGAAPASEVSPQEETVPEGSSGPGEPDAASGPPGGGAGSEGWERLIRGIPDTACLVLSLEGPPDARLRLTRLASEYGRPVDCDTSGRGGPTIAGQVVREQAAELGVKLGWRELSLLLTTVGTDCGRLVSELEKIAVYCGGRAPAEKDILLLCARTAESDIWQLLDAVDASQADEALRIVRAALARGESPVALVASLASQVRMMARARERVQAGIPPHKLASALGANRYWVEQSLRRARRFALEALYDALCELARLDLAIKTGVVEGETGVQDFVLGLCSARAAKA